MVPRENANPNKKISKINPAPARDFSEIAEELRKRDLELFGNTSIQVNVENNKPPAISKRMEFVDPNPLLGFIKDIEAKTEPKNKGMGEGPSEAQKGAENGNGLSEPILI